MSEDEATSQDETVEINGISVSFPPLPPMPPSARTVPGNGGHGTLTPYTPERARVAAQRRKIVAQRRALEGMLAGAKRVSPERLDTWKQAWRELVAVQSEKALGGDTPAFSAVGRATGLMTDHVERDAPSGGPAGGSMSEEEGEALRRLLAAFREWESRPENAAKVRAASDVP